MSTIAAVMWEGVTTFRYAVAALFVSIGIYAAAVLTDEAVDVSEYFADLHTLTEAHEIDELLIGLLMVGVALLVDLSRNLKRTRSALEREHVRLERSHADLVSRTAELEQANAALREAQTKLVEMERLAAVRDMVVSLHHEVLNPLTGVLGAIELLKDRGGVAPERLKVLDCAEQAARRIERLIKGLPELERIERVPYVGSTTMIDLRTITSDAVHGGRQPLIAGRDRQQGE